MTGRPSPEQDALLWLPLWNTEAMDERIEELRQRYLESRDRARILEQEGWFDIAKLLWAEAEECLTRMAEIQREVREAQPKKKPEPQEEPKT